MSKPSNHMTLARFKTILDVYGANIKRWPQEELRGALTVLETSEEARLLRNEAALLDSVLDLAPPSLASPELKREILTDIQTSPWECLAQELWPFGPIWRPAVAMVFLAMLGLAVGGFYQIAPQQFVETKGLAFNDYQEAEMLAFGPDYILEFIP